MVCGGSGLSDPWCRPQLGRLKPLGMAQLAGVGATWRLLLAGLVPRLGPAMTLQQNSYTWPGSLTSWQPQTSYTVLRTAEDGAPEDRTQLRGILGPCLQIPVASLLPDSTGQSSHNFRFKGWGHSPPPPPPILNGRSVTKLVAVF